MNLKVVGLFPTAIDKTDRVKLYKELKKTKLERINLVHLRHDMDEKEIEELIRMFGVEKFNIHHPNASYFPYKFSLRKYRRIIFIENTLQPIDDIVGSWAGMCLDTAHAESQKLVGKKIFKDFDRAMKLYPVGAAHISAIAKNKDQHWFDSLSELDYVMNYVPYLPDVCNLELENNLEGQLEAKKYLEKKLKF